MLGHYSTLSLYVCLYVCSAVSNSLWLHRLKPARLLYPWDFPARILEWLLFPSPGDLPNSGIEPMSPASPALAGRIFFLPLSHLESTFSEYVIAPLCNRR